MDQNGILYIAGNSGSEADTIFRYDPNEQVVEAIYNEAEYLATPWDVIIKSGNIYVTNYSGQDGYKILQLDSDLVSITNRYGTGYEEPVSPGEFYGPRRFVAVLNRKLTITDDGGIGSGLARLVAIDDDFDNATWEEYGTWGENSDGEGHLRLWAC